MNRLKRFYENNRKIYKELIINDLRMRYNGSFLGLIWGLIQPLATILIYCLVFQYGMRAGQRPDGVPFVMYMLPGAIPWFFFSEALGGTTTSFVDYSYLVKKLNFDIGLLPLVKIGSALLIHFAFLGLTIVVLNIGGYYISWHYIQIIYYMIATIALVYVLGLITASLSVYIRDVVQLVGIILQVGFWACPISWGEEMLEGFFGMLLRLNPMFYCVDGYRRSLLTREAIWVDPWQTVYFWTVILVLWIIARHVYKKLKPGFADVM